MTAEIDITPKEKSNFWFQLVDWSNDGWEPVLWCGYEEIESATVNDNLITVVFTLRPLEPGKQLPASVNDFGFNFGYNDDFYPELVKFTNLKFEVIE